MDIFSILGITIMFFWINLRYHNKIKSYELSNQYLNEQTATRL